MIQYFQSIDIIKVNCAKTGHLIYLISGHIINDIDSLRWFWCVLIKYNICGENLWGYKINNKIYMYKMYKAYKSFSIGRNVGSMTW